MYAFTASIACGRGIAELAIINELNSHIRRINTTPHCWINFWHAWIIINRVCCDVMLGSGTAPGRTHVSLCRSASLSLDTRSFCESLLFSPSTVSSAGRDSSKRVPVVDWMDKCMQCSLCRSSEHRDRDPWPVQPRASACCSIRARAKKREINACLLHVNIPLTWSSYMFTIIIIIIIKLWDPDYEISPKNRCNFNSI